MKNLSQIHNPYMTKNEIDVYLSLDINLLCHKISKLLNPKREQLILMLSLIASICVLGLGIAATDKNYISPEHAFFIFMSFLPMGIGISLIKYFEAINKISTHEKIQDIILDFHQLKQNNTLKTIFQAILKRNQKKNGEDRIVPLTQKEYFEKFEKVSNFLIRLENYTLTTHDLQFFMHEYYVTQLQLKNKDYKDEIEYSEKISEHIKKIDDILYKESSCTSEGKHKLIEKEFNFIGK